MKQKNNFGRSSGPVKKSYTSSHLRRMLEPIGGVEALPQNGAAQYGYTGRGWILWFRRDVLAFGHAGVSTAWLENMARTVNASACKTHDVALYYDFGVKMPSGEGPELKRWLRQQERLCGLEKEYADT